MEPQARALLPLKGQGPVGENDARPAGKRLLGRGAQEGRKILRQGGPGSFKKLQPGALFFGPAQHCRPRPGIRAASQGVFHRIGHEGPPEGGLGGQRLFGGNRHRPAALNDKIPAGFRPPARPGADPAVDGIEVGAKRHPGQTRPALAQQRRAEDPGKPGELEQRQIVAGKPAGKARHALRARLPRAFAQNGRERRDRPAFGREHELYRHRPAGEQKIDALDEEAQRLCPGLGAGQQAALTLRALPRHVEGDLEDERLQGCLGPGWCLIFPQGAFQCPERPAE